MFAFISIADEQITSTSMSLGAGYLISKWHRFKGPSINSLDRAPSTVAELS